QLWFLAIINGLGEAATAAHGVAIRCESLGFLSGGAFAVAATALVGQSLGARAPDRAARNTWTAFALGAAMMCAMGAIFFGFAPEMFRLFVGDTKPDVVRLGVPVLRLVAWA